MVFKCKQGCSECCGPVPVKRDILLKHVDKIKKELIEATLPAGDNESVVFTKDWKCIFLNRETNACMIYEDRPQICKDFGISNTPGLACPYIKPNGHMWSTAKAKQIRRRMRDFQNNSFGRLERWHKQQNQK